MRACCMHIRARCACTAERLDKPCASAKQLVQARNVSGCGVRVSTTAVFKSQSLTALLAMLHGDYHGPAAVKQQQQT